MGIRLNPALGEPFWESVRDLPGYRRGEQVRLRWMVFARTHCSACRMCRIVPARAEAIPCSS
jgi:hypothetical protein